MLRFATPLIFGALGGILSERSGVINIGLEGMMLMGAFFGIFGADKTDSWALGLGAGMLAGGVTALVHAFFSIHLRADQIVSGTAINFLALGITGYIFIYHYGDQGTPDDLPRCPTCTLPIDRGHPVLRRRDRPAEPADLGRAARSCCSCGSSCSARRRPAAALGGREPARRRHGRHLRLPARATWR